MEGVYGSEMQKKVAQSLGDLRRFLMRDFAAFFPMLQTQFAMHHYRYSSVRTILLLLPGASATTSVNAKMLISMLQHILTAFQTQIRGYANITEESMDRRKWKAFGT
jgi:hypothetical protein